MTKRKTMTQRRDEFFATIDTLAKQSDHAGYLQGCRAAAPGKHDTDDVRRRENLARSRAMDAHRLLVKQFNAAVRAARAGGAR